MRKDLENRLDTLEINLLNEIHALVGDGLAIDEMVEEEIQLLEETLGTVNILRSMLNNFMVPDEPEHFFGFDKAIAGIEKGLEKGGPELAESIR